MKCVVFARYYARAGVNARQGGVRAADVNVPRRARGRVSRSTREWTRYSGVSASGRDDGNRCKSRGLDSTTMLSMYIDARARGRRLARRLAVVASSRREMDADRWRRRRDAPVIANGRVPDASPSVFCAFVFILQKRLHCASDERPVRVVRTSSHAPTCLYTSRRRDARRPRFARGSFGVRDRSRDAMTMRLIIRTSTAVCFALPRVRSPHKRRERRLGIAILRVSKRVNPTRFVIQLYARSLHTLCAMTSLIHTELNMCVCRTAHGGGGSDATAGVHDHAPRARTSRARASSSVET